MPIFKSNRMHSPLTAILIIIVYLAIIRARAASLGILMSFTLDHLLCPAQSTGLECSALQEWRAGHWQPLWTAADTLTVSLKALSIMSPNTVLPSLNRRASKCPKSNDFGRTLKCHAVFGLHVLCFWHARFNHRLLKKQKQTNKMIVSRTFYEHDSMFRVRYLRK